MDSTSPNAPHTTSARKRGKLRSFVSPLEPTSNTIRSSFKSSLILVEQALASLPIPEAEGVIGDLLDVIKGLEVSCYDFIYSLR